MVTAKLAFVLIQVGSNLWVNPMQLQGVKDNNGATKCPTIILAEGEQCSDWSAAKVIKALSSSSVSRAMEDK